MSAHRVAACWSWSTCRRKTTPHWPGTMRRDIQRSLDNCMAAIRHAREFAIPIAFTRQAEGRGDGPGILERSSQSAWISGLEPRRSDMVFERQQPSCYSNHLFESVVSQAGSFAIAGLVAEETCLATAMDAARSGAQRHLPERCIREPVAAQYRCRRRACARHKGDRTFRRRRHHRPVAGRDVAATSQRASLWMS